MNQIKQVTLAILAGGAGTRMGGPKSGLVLKNTPILQYLIDRLQWPGPTLLVTTPATQNPIGCDLFNQECSDPVDGAGPAQGLLTALQSSTTEKIVLIPVDMPLISRSLLDEVIQYADQSAVLCERRVDGQTLIEPFPGVFSKALIPSLKEYLSTNRRSLHGLLKLPNTGTYNAAHWSAEVWTNLNTPDDLKRLPTTP